ncbi:hypothetical protein [Enterococcus casseliflavus]|uniref:hypothetical protein n=1 Tax=Enterococcus casseliflavus TaxID=37734 RepID=UPI00115AC325|nr:hypothetical protein [Enterococcus casseliflavus]
MDKKKERFSTLYKKIILEDKGYMNEELNELFEDILTNEFDNNPELMSGFIRSIVDENTEREPSDLDKLKLENELLRQEMAITQEALLEISDMILSR